MSFRGLRRGRMKIIGELKINPVKSVLIKREFEIDDKLLEKSNDPDSLIQRAFMDNIKDEIKIDCWYTK